MNAVTCLKCFIHAGFMTSLSLSLVESVQHCLVAIAWLISIWLSNSALETSQNSLYICAVILHASMFVLKVLHIFWLRNRLLY